MSIGALIIASIPTYGTSTVLYLVRHLSGSKAKVNGRKKKKLPAPLTIFGLAYVGCPADIHSSVLSFVIVWWGAAENLQVIIFTINKIYIKQHRLTLTNPFTNMNMT